MRRGRRLTSAHLVLHYLTRPECPAPRAGFVVGKVVGNSVQRHRVIRQLRHVVTECIVDFPSGAQIVVRGLTGAADADADVRSELTALLIKAGLRV